jgi:hypothetical protein
MSTCAARKAILAMCAVPRVWGWRPGEVGCHAQQERGGQPHDLMPRQMPHLGQARRQVRGGDAVVAGLAGAGRGYWYLP